MRRRGRVVVIVLDGLGIGELSDASLYGDVGCNTLGHLYEAVSALKLPHLEGLGLSKLVPTGREKTSSNNLGFYGRMAEASLGKDTLIGHWEMMGLITDTPFPSYPNGFPSELIASFEVKINLKVLGNRVASGTEIIAALGEEHMESGKPIVYTSADSVFQVAAHEEIISPSELYEICRIARDLLIPPHGVARVIARPFTGSPGCFTRTEGRRDFALSPSSETLLDHLQKNEIPVVGIGKIEDIFSGKGLSKALHTQNNQSGVDETLRVLGELETGLIFTNLADFDMLYGHRNDADGYAMALCEFDQRLPEIIAMMGKDDWLFLTGDHGNDPLFPGTDHTREYVPLLVYREGISSESTGFEHDLGTRECFSDLGQTVADIFQIPPLSSGKSFLNLMV